MYPLHKYVPTPFGTYLMYINHGKERVNVDCFPKDMKSFKQELAANPKKFQDKKEQKKGSNFGEKSSSKKARDIRPSYQIHFLEHTGQTITEPPANVTIVDDITGAEVTTSMSWVRNRPKRWKERLRAHKIENPRLTSTLKKPLPSVSKQPSYPAGERLLQMRLVVDDKNIRKVAPPQQDPSNPPLTPHLTQLGVSGRGREKWVERDKEARKRRRKADKLMELVSNRARIARVKAHGEFERNLSLEDMKSSKYSNSRLVAHRRSESVEPTFPRRSLLPSVDDPRRSSSEMRISGDELRARNTIYEEIKPQKIQDWNPREDHQELNRIILERMGAAMPYKWNSEALEESVSTTRLSQPQYHYVL